jgi:amino acid adenylation domain-containing protein
VVTAFSLPEEVGGDGPLPPIGRPVAGARVYLLDRGWQPVPIGYPGELYVGGSALARGYLGRPELTAERFLPDPVSLGPGGRLYRTGDRARYRADGEIEFLGRVDDQLKVRGYRVEPGEVEATLGRHPGVRACAVAPLRLSGEVRLVAYVVAAEGAGEGLPAELRRFLRAALPDPLVPSQFVLLDVLPLTPSGKVDRRALPAPETEVAGAPAVRSPLEEIVAEVWAEVLGREGIPLHESFFDLGGHSLLATQVVSRLRRACRVELSVRALFEAPTVAALARRIEALAGAEPREGELPLERVARSGRLPLSFAQQRIWFLDQLQPGLAAYNIPVALRLRGPLDRGALARSLGAVVRRHEILRTNFPAPQGEPSQVIGSPPGTGALELPEIDLGAMSRCQGGAGPEAMRRLERESWRPFDLARDQLIRPLLIRLAAQEHIFLLVIHHIASDAWSLAVLLNELSALYGRAADLPSPLAELPIQYADFAGWQRAWLVGEALDRQLAYWKPLLAGAAVLDLPLDRPRPAVQSYRGGVLPFTVPPDLWARLRSLSRSEGITPFMALLAAFQIVLHRWSGQDDVTVGFPIAGRTRAETESLIGCFVNMLALRSRLLAGMTLQDLLEGVRRDALGAYAHQDLPFEKLVEELQPERQMNHSPVFQALITLDNVPRQSFSLGEARAETVSIPGGRAKLDLTLALSETGRGLAGALEYNADLFLPATLARLRERLSTLLSALGDHLDRPLSDLALLSLAERHQLLMEWGEAAVELPALAEVCVHRMFERQAAITPDAIALVDGERRVTYRELDRRSNQLARFLAERGVGPEVRVGLSLERDGGLVVALLAVLKAGGVYLPLDPAYPAERLRFMAEDGGAALIVAGRRGLDRLSALGLPCVLLESERSEIEALSADAVQAGIGPANLSHLIYTSGSTGRPKGVAITHRGTVALLGWAQRVFTSAELAGVLASTSIGFDLSVFEILVTLGAGGRVILVENALYLGDLPAAAEVTLVNTVPSVAAEILRGAGFPPSVRTVNLAGEALRAELATAILSQAGVERLYNLYGPSEDTTYSTWARIGPEESEPPSIGLAVDGGRSYVLSADLELASPGVAGELCLGGDGLSRGYQGRPALTAESFIPDAWSGRCGERLYRTGDLAVRRMDGRLAFLGRRDHQVKLRGFRIEPGEIEAAITNHPEFVAAAVVVRPSVHGGEPRLVAYVVPAETAGIEIWDPTELREDLRAWLPAHLVPAAFIPLAALPRTAGGKVDRRALPDTPGVFGAVETYEEPRSEVEQAVARIWSETLGIERIGLDDNFFNLGGHSLLLARVYHRLLPLFARSFPLIALFEHATVRATASFLDLGGHTSSSRSEGQERGARRREAAERRRPSRETEP